MDSNAVAFVNEGVNFIGRTFEYNGMQGKIEKQAFKPNDAFTITATVIGNYKYVKYQTEPYYCSQNINKLTPKSIFTRWNKMIAYYFVSNIQKFVSLYDGQQGGYKLNDIKNHKIKLPLNNNQIDFDFMEVFIAELEAERIAELEAYLTAAGLKDYELTPQEKKALDEFESHNFLCGQFKFKDIFDKVAQGRRLKKDDQIYGDIPFIMSGITNTGVVNYIANPVAFFLKNSITVDIFGNVFYRGYNFGAGDDTGVYWSDKQDYSKEVMLYFTASMSKALKGRFDYGNKLRSSQSLNIKMQLPIKENKLDNSLMTTLISAIQKLVIKDVVLFTERKITANKQVVQS